MDNQFVLMLKYKSKNKDIYVHILAHRHTYDNMSQAKEIYVSDLLQWHWNLSHSQKIKNKNLYKIRLFLSFAFCHSLQLQLIYRHVLNLSSNLFFCFCVSCVCVSLCLIRFQMNNKSDFICMYIYAMLSHISNKWCLTSFSSCGDFLFFFLLQMYINLSWNWIVCGKCCWFDGDLGILG